jgi:hypothetical protein
MTGRDTRGHCSRSCRAHWRRLSGSVDRAARQASYGGTSLQECPGTQGNSVDDFLQTMGLMAAALQFDCSDCHVGAGTVIDLIRTCLATMTGLHS